MKASLVPRVDPSKVKTHGFKDYAIRFVFGAGIALGASLIGMKFGSRVGGVFLGFPAILPAALTLIQKTEGKDEASIDSMGALLGAIAMVLFAVTVTWTVTRWGVLTSLGVSLGVWIAVAVGLYFLVTGVTGREPEPR